MNTINNQVESILDKRLGRGEYVGKGRLQRIESKISSLKNVQTKIEELDALIACVQKELDTQQGKYFNLMAADPESTIRFKEVSTKNALNKINKTLMELENLKARFSREAIRIAFIGRERQGKSTFLKTITGLSNKIIPAYSGNSCTGAVSVIHNSDKPLSVRVEYYSTPEFISIVQEKLNNFFGIGTYRIGRLEDITNLSIPENLSGVASAKQISEFEKFKDSVINHYNDYSYLIGKGKCTYNNEDEIAQHVAQYEEFPVQVEDSVWVRKEDGKDIYQKSYYKYVAVKSVDIYAPFKVDTTKKIELVDTIGLGNSSDTPKVESEMFRVLREDCDAAVNLFRPENIAAYPDVQVNLLDKLWENLSDREPSKWVVYVINKVTKGNLVNDSAISELKKNIHKLLDNKIDRKPVAWVRDVMGDDLTSVSSDLITPLLTLVAENLDSLDNALMLQADELSNEAYNECLQLVKSANAVTSSSTTLTANKLLLFDQQLYETLIASFGRALNQIDDLGYAKKKDQSCDKLQQAYQNIIDNIGDYIPTPDGICEQFITGANLTPTQVFEEHVEQLRNDIFAAFENVNTEVLIPLQEQVKCELIKILYEQGKMKSLPVNVPLENENYIEWLKALMSCHIDKDTYPSLHNALNFILDYQINIEGLVEYNVTRALYVIDRTNEEYIPYIGSYSNDFRQKADNVWQELVNRISPLQERMRRWIGDFTMIPSHSFYSRVHKFHVKLTTDKDGKNDLRKFYINNMGLIWAQEIIDADQAEIAFGDWTDRVKSLQEVVTYNNFKI